LLKQVCRGSWLNGLRLEDRISAPDPDLLWQRVEDNAFHLC